MVGGAGLDGGNGGAGWVPEGGALGAEARVVVVLLEGAARFTALRVNFLGGCGWWWTRVVVVARAQGFGFAIYSVFVGDEIWGAHWRGYGETADTAPFVEASEGGS